MSKRIFISLILVCLVIGALQVGLSYYLIADAPWNYDCHSEVLPGQENTQQFFHQLKVNLGYKYRLLMKDTCWFEYLGKRYTFTRRIDQYGRRMVPMRTDVPKKSFIAFIGGSTSFGSGINDEDTMEAQTAALLPSVAVYNYGAGAFATHQNLRRLELFPMNKEIPETNGVGLLFFHTYYIERLRGDFCYLVKGEGTALAPSYHMTPEGNLQFAGPYEKVLPFKMALARIFSSVAVVSNYCMQSQLRQEDSHFEPTYRDRDYQFVTLMIKAAQDQFLKNFPGGHFVVLLFGEAETVQKLSMRLDEKKIKNFNYSLPEKKIERTFIGHWDKEGSGKMASQIVSDLRNLGWIEK